MITKPIYMWLAVLAIFCALSGAETVSAQLQDSADMNVIITVQPYFLVTTSANKITMKPVDATFFAKGLIGQSETTYGLTSISVTGNTAMTLTVPDQVVLTRGAGNPYNVTATVSFDGGGFPAPSGGYYYLDFNEGSYSPAAILNVGLTKVWDPSTDVAGEYTGTLVLTLAQQFAHP